MCAPTINYVMAREVAITLSFQLCSVHYTVLQMKNSTRGISAINPVATENTGDKHNSQHSHREAASCYREPTPCTASYQRKELEHRGGQKQVHDACIVHTAVGKKAHLKTKQHRTVRKSSL